MRTTDACPSTILRCYDRHIRRCLPARQYGDVAARNPNRAQSPRQRVCVDRGAEVEGTRDPHHYDYDWILGWIGSTTAFLESSPDSHDSHGSLLFDVFDASPEARTTG
eukprot:3390995-Pyramimonas_sp.AAC.1